MLEDPADRAGYLVWQTAHVVGREIAAALEAFDMTPAQFGAVVHTSREPGISAAELARRLNLTPQSVQTALRPLLDRGLMQRRPHPVHRRVLGNFLTDEGDVVAQQSSEAVAGVDGRMLAMLDPQQRVQLKALVTQVLLALNPTALDRSSVRVPGAP